MRLYQKKLIRKLVKQETAKKREIRNGIIWSVDSNERVCRVKIQGSNNQIVAWYPENWEATPAWLKKGNAVTIAHNGNRGRIEVLGHGQVIPSPVSGDQLPDTDTAEDAIVSGFKILQTDPPSMTVSIGAGVVRFDGTEYNVAATTKVIDTAPSSSTQLRYDLISVGNDLVVDYTAGTAFSHTGTANFPSVQSNHLVIAYILVRGQVTEIYTSDVRTSATHNEARPSKLLVEATDDDLSWTQETTQVQVTVVSQYDIPITAPEGTYTFYLRFSYGDGQLYSSISGWKDYDDNNGEVQGMTSPGSSRLFSYRRYIETTDQSPFLQAEVEWTETSHDLVGYVAIVLRDSSGEKMT